MNRSIQFTITTLFAITALLSTTLAPSAVAKETLLERGTYLMRSIVACGNCHTPKNMKGQELPGMELAGGFGFVEPMYTWVTANITPDKETGIGNWTDAQIIDAIRNGKRPNGSTIGPPMPIELYRRLSDRDVKAIVAYLRQVKPVKNKVAKSVYKFPLPPNYGATVWSVPEVSRSNPVKYGAYLAGPLGHCILCHTPMVKGRFQFKTHLGSGGLTFYLPFGEVYSANITPDKATGLGNWSDGQIKHAITKGLGKEGKPLFPPMPFPYFANISAADQDALVAYLRSMKPLPTSRKVRFVPKKK